KRDRRSVFPEASRTLRLQTGRTFGPRRSRPAALSLPARLRLRAFHETVPEIWSGRWNSASPALLEKRPRSSRSPLRTRGASFRLPTAGVFASAGSGRVGCNVRHFAEKCKNPSARPPFQAAGIQALRALPGTLECLVRQVRGAVRRI